MSENCDKNIETIENQKKNDEEIIVNDYQCKSDEFYEHAKKYWSKIPPTVDGMLGGFGFISDTDIKGSRLFLKSLINLNNGPAKDRALDCGAGIGRITKHLLAPIFKKVDMVEQNPNFVKNSLSYLGKYDNKIENKFVVGLQEFVPREQYYDVIWCQWVLGHLKDEHLHRFLTLCQSGLKENGVIVVKENVTSSDQVEMDIEDSSVTRPHTLLEKIFLKSNLQIIKDVKQTNFPKGLYGVHMFALKPKTIIKSDDLHEKLNELTVND